MHVSTDKVQRAFALAQRLLRELKLGDGDDGKPVVSIDELADRIRAISGVRIEIIEVAFEAVHLRGRLERFSDGSAVIHVRSDQEVVWKRFVTAKELLHIIIDEEEDFSPYGDQTLDELVRKGYLGLASSHALGGDPAQSEVVAEIAALEVLYPFARRKDDLFDLQNGRINRVRLAHRYGLPAHYNATALDPLYLEKLVECFVEDGGNVDMPPIANLNNPQAAE